MLVIYINTRSQTFLSIRVIDILMMKMYGTCKVLVNETFKHNFLEGQPISQIQFHENASLYKRNFLINFIIKRNSKTFLNHAGL